MVLWLGGSQMGWDERGDESGDMKGRLKLIGLKKVYLEEQIVIQMKRSFRCLAC